MVVDCKILRCFHPSCNLQNKTPSDFCNLLLFICLPSYHQKQPLVKSTFPSHLKKIINFDFKSSKVWLLQMLLFQNTEDRESPTGTSYLGWDEQRCLRGALGKAGGGGARFISIASSPLLWTLKRSLTWPAVTGGWCSKRLGVASLGHK